MTHQHEPTEVYDGSVEVHVFADDGGRETIRCPSFEAAIETVKDVRSDAEVVEMVDPEGEVVFDSVDMTIEDWAVEWKHAKRSLSVDVEQRECPYDNVACFADDLCVQCKIDKVQDQL